MAFTQPIFQIRGTAIKPYYSKGSSECTTIKKGTSAADAAIVTTAADGSFGTSAIDFTSVSAATARYLKYNTAGGNCPGTGALSVLLRVVPLWTGSPTTRQPLVNLGALNDDAFVVMNITTTGKFYLEIANPKNADLVVYTSTASISFTANTPTDIMFTWDGTTSANAIKLYQDGTLVESATASAAASYWDAKAFGSLSLGIDYIVGASANNYYLREFCIFDSVQSAYAPRSTFVTSSNLNGDTVPAAVDVRLNVVTGLNTGSLIAAAAATTKIGVLADNGTGTYDGSDRWSDPGAINVAAGVSYKANSTTNNQTGTRQVVTNSVGTAVLTGASTSATLVAKSQ